MSSTQEGVSSSSSGDEPVFFQHRDGPILPTLKFVHKYPKLQFTNVKVDKGAIPFLLGGANVMCPGLTNVGGEMPPDDNNDNTPALQKGDGVIIYAEGKILPIAVGFMLMSSIDIRKKNKGLGIEVCHFLGDGLWGTDEIQ
jgi:PUA domain protein